MVLKAGLLVLVAMFACLGESEGSCPSSNHVNGCSIPLGAPFPYKKQFKPACDKHDVCYECGQKYGWSRDACDKAFKRDMESICDSLYAGRKRSWWTHAKNALKIGKEIVKWPFISKQPDNCRQGAKIYYMSVDSFGQSSVSKISPSWCSNKCVIKNGSPAHPLSSK